jgi:hypothetical protein
MFINGVEIPYLITNAVEITQAEYNALADKSGTYIITDAVSTPLSANSVTYSNTASGLAATTVQGAIDEVSGKQTNIISGTLAAGSTAVTFTDASITTDSIIDPYQYVTPGSTVSIIAPTQIIQSNGSCTLIFDAQESAVTVGIRVF